MKIEKLPNSSKSVLVVSPREFAVIQEALERRAMAVPVSMWDVSNATLATVMLQEIAATEKDPTLS